MDIFVLLLIAILVYLLPSNDEYLGVRSTTGLKGFLALGIVFHHLSQWVATGSEFVNFRYMGPYLVSIFFFLFFNCDNIRLEVFGLILSNISWDL